jgi:hypothetical protein
MRPERLLRRINYPTTIFFNPVRVKIRPNNGDLFGAGMHPAKQAVEVFTLQSSGQNQKGEPRFS